MNTNLIFLAGTVVIAVIGSLILWLVTRPRTRSATPGELQKILRGASQKKPRRMQNPDGIRVIGSEEKIETQTERED
ncbi:MAG: hypothetical protein CL452_04875 [Acidimicrobiaceae bacterium]|jgi:hypothetical protein|nr:hypothetical protein [Acidimicrobiaceae bacterium]MBD27067.1 hypothetical protein [Acidimicrobiaceae bacterium]MBI30694.1 hypothetical protein [Actinomycetota bacterium]MCH2407965.1 hypothetical protein [Acidimicrobiales bacterium]|tara:strand:- start:17524 stop:17754 length:231 start_codon:yes stop_codon:yes gene_type:complete